MAKNRLSHRAIAGVAALTAGLLIFTFLAVTRAADRRALKYKLAAMENAVSVVYARRNLPKGTLIRSEDVDYQRVPPAYVAPGYAGKKSAVVGREAVSDILAGEPILSPRISGAVSRRASTMIKAGRVALAVGTDEITGVAGAIRAGDHVDVLVTDEERSATRLFLANAQVLGIGGVYPFSRREESREAGDQSGLTSSVETTVILELTPSQAGRLTQASEAGKIRLVLRAAR